MTLKYPPAMGQILICDFSSGFVEPEMVKVRPVVVISPKPRKSIHSLCTVVPLSTTEPLVIEKYHHSLVFDRPLPKPFNAKACWVKSDMISTVSYARLSLPRSGRDTSGNRKYIKISVSPEDIGIIRQCVLHALGF